jgi:hypothetical protein
MEEKVFLVRINFEIQNEMIQYCYDNNCIAILVDQEDEKEVWRKHIKEDKLNKSKKQFIDRWFGLQESVFKNDVLVLVTYRGGKKAKIGKIIKGTKFEEYEKDRQYKIFKFEVNENSEFDLEDFPIFSSIIPSHVTISPVIKRAEIIRHLYKYGNLNQIDINLNNISEKSVELICLEWLRSTFAKENKLKYQLLLVGGNYHNIDIFGVTDQGKRIAAQVTTTNNKHTIDLKIEKIKNHHSDVKLIFSNCNNISKPSPNIQMVSLDTVWNDLLNNGYEEMLTTLVRE